MKLGRFLNNLIFGRRVRALLLLGAFIFLTTIVTPASPPRMGNPALATLVATPVALDPRNPENLAVGALVYRRGWNLDSDDPRFGGISAMQVVGAQIVAMSDDGNIFRFSIPGAGPPRLDIFPLRDGPGDRNSKFNRDTEALWFSGSEAWIAYERHNMIWRHRLADWRATSAARPEAMHRWGRNSGPEALVRLGDGRFILFAEGGGRSFSEVLLFDDDPAVGGRDPARLRYRQLPGYRVTDAAVLPDGRLLILNRRFNWMSGFSAKLAVAETRDLAAGATIEPREIADLGPPFTTDNMEALSVVREGERTIVRIASDDNFMRLQRTLLLEFELREPT